MLKDYVYNFLLLLVSYYNSFLKYAITTIKLLRIDKPIGYFLLLWPVLWILAIYDAIFSEIGFLLIISTIFIRSYGCLVNDILDRKFDSLVERTKSRPLAASNKLLKFSIILLVLLSFIGLFILTLLPQDIIKICFAYIPLIFIYPLLKRFSYFPQVILGIAFNGVIITWISVVGYEKLSAMVLLFLAVAFWVIGFDIIYALSDIQYDKKL